MATATLKPAVIPKEASVAVLSFSSISNTASATCKLIQSEIVIAAIELMGGVQMKIANQHKSQIVRE